MILTLAWKALVAHPVRTAVLGVGFGLGVGVMATLLGVGEVVLEQARAPELVGGGQLILHGVTGPITSARFAMAMLQRIPAAGGPQSTAPTSTAPVIASPRKRADLFLVRGGAIVPVHARGGIPSLERALDDSETASIAGWTDTAADAAWSSPASGDVLRAMDRFHSIPDVPDRAASWAEWLYFRGQIDGGPTTPVAADQAGGRELTQFYLAFLAGPKQADGQRMTLVQLQLDRRGDVTTYAESAAVDDATLVESAPDIAVGRSRVRLEGLKYHVSLDLPSPRTSSRAIGEIVIEAIPGRSLPPVVIRGAGGWVSGYTVPVMSGRLSGSLAIDGAPVTLAGTAYHDHNWGFWDGVSWRWGQVQHEGLSYIYGRVLPPADAADPERSPGVLVALGPDGPVGYSSRVSIDETDDPVTHRPRRIVVQGRGASLDLTLDLTVESAIVHRGGALAGAADFLQLHARYHVTGRAGGQPVDFTEAGAAETFRSR